VAVVIDEFEASGAPAGEAKGDGAPPREPHPHETRRLMRMVALRAARLSPR
jgi:hypothetical protein